MLTLLLFLSISPARAADTIAPLRLGSVAMDTPAAMHQRLTPLTEYLGRTLGRPVVLKLSSDMTSAIGAIASNEVDFAYLTPVAYVNAHARGVKAVVKAVTNGRASFKLSIVVRADGPIRSVSDLAGKRFAFGDPAALLQRAVVVGAGMPLARLGSHVFLNHYDNIVRGVLSQEYDAGIVLETVAEQWQDKGLRILYRSPDLPPYIIAAGPGTDASVRSKLKEALLALDPQNPEHQTVIAALDKTATGFVSVTDAEYDVVRRLIKPFKK